MQLDVSQFITVAEILAIPLVLGMVYCTLLWRFSRSEYKERVPRTVPLPNWREWQ
jgi:hypothetical protein